MTLQEKYDALQEKFNTLERDYEVAARNYSAVNAQLADLKKKTYNSQRFNITLVKQVRKYENANEERASR